MLYAYDRLYAPVLYPVCAFFLVMKGLADGILIICVYGPDMQSNGSLFSSALGELQIGLIIMHLVLMNQSYWNESPILFAVNTCMVFFILFLCHYFRKHRVCKFSNMSKNFKDLDFSTPTCVDKSEWIYKYCHPLVKKLPNYPHVIKELNPDRNPGPVTGSNDDTEMMDRRTGHKNKSIDIKGIFRVENHVRQLLHSQSIIEN